MKVIATILLLPFFLGGCSEDAADPGPEFSNQPEAKSAFDNSRLGVYKGTIVGSSLGVNKVGSSGSVKIYYKNGDEKIESIITINGKTMNLSGSAAGDLVTFSSASASFTFSVASNGTGPTISEVVIDGYPDAMIAIMKELSNDLVQVFEGAFSGDDSGVFNVVLNTTTLRGIGFSNLHNVHFPITGTINDGELSVQTYIGNAAGSISGKKITGTWDDIYGNKGTWEANRTL